MGEPTIWVLVIEHRHGANTYVHKTEAGAQQSLRAYVDDNWAQELGTRPVPDDEEDMIAEYFERVDDEHYSLDTNTLGD